MSGPKRADAGAAVAGLFTHSSATGGLARREPDHEPRAATRAGEARRQGVELTESDVDVLRSLSRPGRTGQPRTSGASSSPPASCPPRSRCCARATSTCSASRPATSRR